MSGGVGLYGRSLGDCVARLIPYPSVTVGGAGDDSGSGPLCVG